MGKKMIAVNKRARREYHVMETFETGLVLLGAEVKSLRLGHVNFKDAYVTISRDMQAYIEGLHIGIYRFAAANFNHSPTRRRRLLMHRREIQRLYGRISEKGLTVIPLAIYLRRHLIKLEVGLARGKRLYDKRHDLAKRDHDREMQRALKERM